jgi:plastocyanin
LRTERLASLDTIRIHPEDHVMPTTTFHRALGRPQHLAVMACCLVLFLRLHAAGAAEWATFEGRFVFGGSPATPTEITADKDVEVCGKHKLMNEELVVGADKGVANVVVFVRSKSVTVHPDIADGSKAAPVTLDNQGCRFEPHVGFVQTGQKLVVKNSDPVGHNSNIATIKNPPSNNLIPSGGQAEIVFGSDEAIPAQVTCNIHPWMKAWVVVRPNPYAAVSKADGSFAISNLPVGEELEFQFWHEKAGYIDSMVIGGKQTKASKGRMKVTLTADGKNLGDVVLAEGIFKK